MRFFRFDRIDGVELTTELFEPPAALSPDDVLTDGRAFSAATASVMTVRYSPRIARWIAEREDGELQADGSFVVRHPLADLNWGVRHVLQYGPDAEVLSPRELRRAITDALSAMESAVA